MVDQVPIVPPVNEHNARYIATKRENWVTGRPTIVSGGRRLGTFCVLANAVPQREPAWNENRLLAFERTEMLCALGLESCLWRSATSAIFRRR